MGCEEVSNNYLGYYGCNNPYQPMANFLTNTLGHTPCNIWAARNCTQMANVWNHSASYPYGFYFNFTGRPHYIVADAFQMPYQTAMEFQTGQTYGVPTITQLQTRFAQMNAEAGLRIKASNVYKDLGKAQSIGACKDQEFMKADENKALRDEVIACEKQAKELLKQLEETMKNANSLSPAEVEAKVDVYYKLAKDLVGKTDDLFKRIDEAAKAYAEKKADEARSSAEDAAGKVDSGDDSGSGSNPVDGKTTVTTTEGDTELKDNEALSAEYGVKAPVIESEQDVISVVSNVKRNTNNSDDAKNYTNFTNMFTTGEINAGNVVEVLCELDGYDLYSGIYEMDNAYNAMKLVFDPLKARIDALKEAGYLTATEAKEMKDLVNELIKAIPTKDDAGFWDTKPTIKVSAHGHGPFDYNGVLRYLASTLKDKGTQADFDAKINAKKTERETKAKKDFYSAHAKEQTGKSVKDENADLPEGITYLPNSKQFQWKCGDNVFKGETYSKLNDAVYDSKISNVISEWVNVLKKLDENLK